MSPSTWTLEALAAAAAFALLGYRARLRRGGRTRVLASRRGKEGRIVVRETPAARELWFVRGRKETLQGAVVRGDPLTSALAYTDGFHLVPPATTGAPRVLFLGCGTGIGPRQFVAFYPNVRVDVVEHDPAVLAVARAFFHLRPSPRLALHEADARTFLERAGDARWDRIVVDAFGAGEYPARLSTAEFFASCKERLTETGALLVNLGGTFAPEAPSDSRLRAVLGGIVATFGADATRAYGVPLENAGAKTNDPSKAGNTIAVAFRGEAPSPKGAAPPRLFAMHRARLPELAAIAGGLHATLDAGAPLHDADVGRGVDAALPIA